MGTYTIAFNIGGAGTRPNATAASGSWVAVAKPPAFAGHVFDGWISAGHDTASARYSLSPSGSNSVDMAADPMPVSVDSDGSVWLNCAEDGALVTLTARWRTEFGGANAGCPTIEFPAFTPICSKGGIGASAPASFDVPVPVYAPIVPPPECVCLSFVDNTPANTTNIEVNIDKGNKSGKGTGTAKVEIKSAGDCCNGKYTVTPTIDITIPECSQKDGILSSDTVSLADGKTVTKGSITYKLTVKDCIPRLEITTVPLEINVPSGGADICLADTQFTLKGKYTLGTGDNEYTNTFFEKTVNLKKSIGAQGTSNAGCWMYTMDDIELDLSSVAFGNGGSVFKDSSDGNLYTDSSLSSGDTWYGGGVGDHTSTGEENNVRGRSINQRAINIANSSGTTMTDVPYVERAFRFVTLAGDQRQTWESEKKGVGGSLTTGDGNLSVMMPTGFQWAHNGVALNVVGFEWNPSGLLRSARETGCAAVLAPAMSIFKDNKTMNGQSVSLRSAGGLWVVNSNSMLETGLSVKDGCGLRIFGVDDKTGSAEVTASTLSRVGSLEVDDGLGLRCFGKDSKTENGETGHNGQLEVYYGNGLTANGAAAKTSASLNKPGQLEVYVHDGDFAFTPKGRLVLNDTKTSPCSDTDGYILIPTVPEWVDGRLEPGSFGRDSDMVIRAVVCADDMMYWGSEVAATSLVSGNAYNSGRITMYNNYNKDSALVESVANYLTPLGYPKNTTSISTTSGDIAALRDAVGRLGRALGHVVQSLASIGVVTLHVSRAGTIIRVDDDVCSDIPRHVDSTS